MQILVTDSVNENGRIGFEMQCGNKSAYVSWNQELGMISVCCLNASHKAWKGLGRTFWSWTEAKSGYKSAAMRAMIEFVEAESRPTLKIAG